MAELLRKNIHTINEHVNNIYCEKELLEESTIRKFRIVQQEGLRQILERWNFIISK